MLVGILLSSLRLLGHKGDEVCHCLSLHPALKAVDDIKAHHILEAQQQDALAFMQSCCYLENVATLKKHCFATH